MQTLCSVNVALTVDEARLCGRNDQFRMTVLSRANPKLSLDCNDIRQLGRAFSLGQRHCYDKGSRYNTEGLTYAVKVGWTSLFRRCAGVRDLTLKGVDTSTFRALLKLPSRRSPCIIYRRSAYYLTHLYSLMKDASRFRALKDFSQRAQRSWLPTEKVVIGTCNITEAAVEELKEFTEVIWDGEERNREVLIRVRPTSWHWGKPSRVLYLKQREVELAGSLVQVVTTYAVKALEKDAKAYTIALSSNDKEKTSWLEAKVKGQQQALLVRDHGTNLPSECKSLLVGFRVDSGSVGTTSSTWSYPNHWGSTKH
ncbi:dolichyl-diphosphooligosaccharide--protein glycosyltransferase [Salix suchowensis]|nr:dolichyl-diphosphooligosaccharide--protein glycosyltransferase [Salix suchowensis]